MRFRCPNPTYAKNPHWFKKYQKTTYPKDMVLIGDDLPVYEPLNKHNAAFCHLMHTADPKTNIANMVGDSNN